MNVQAGDVTEPRHEVFRERRVEDDALLELHFLAQRRPDSHDQAAVDLRGEVAGVEDGAALEDLACAADHDLALLDGDLDARGDARSLLGVSALDVSIQGQIVNLMKDLQRDLGLTSILHSPRPFDGEIHQ